MSGAQHHCRIITCCDHGFETGLLVNPRPNDVAGLGPPMTKGQEAQSQAHSRCHGNHKAACCTANTWYPDKKENLYFTYKEK